MDFAFVLFLVIVGTILFASVMTSIRHWSRRTRLNRNRRDQEWYGSETPRSRSAAAGPSGSGSE